MQFVDPAFDAARGDAPTRARVARSILENGPSTAAVLGERLGLTPAAVRRHLDQLVDGGDVASEQPRPTGTRGRGRPARVFRLTEGGRDRFDQQYDDLANQALRYVAETGGRDAVREFSRRRFAFIERDYEQITGDDPELTPAEALARVFSEQGYAASVRTVPLGGVEQLCQQHCPVSHVAHEFPELCEAETEAIGRVLGTHVQRLATIAHGDGVCTTSIPRAADQTGTTDQTTSTTDRKDTEA